MFIKQLKKDRLSIAYRVYSQFRPYLSLDDYVRGVLYMMDTKGYMLLKRIEDYAMQNNMDCIALSSGIERTAAHSFYVDKAGYAKPSFVFKKTQLPRQRTQ